MPRRDGSGPMGTGPKTGRGLGACACNNSIVCVTGLRLGSGWAFRRGFFVNQNSFNTQKELLQKQMDALRDRLDVIDNQLEKLKVHQK